MAKKVTSKKSNVVNNRPNCLKITKRTQKVNLQTVTTTIYDSEEYYAIEITLGNFSLDFKNSHEDELGEFVVYENVGLNIYPGKYSVNLLK